MFIDWWRFQVERQIIGLPAGEVDDTLLKNWTFNGTWQVSGDHKVSIRYFTDRKFRGNRGAGPSTPPESAWIQDSFVDIPQAQWQGVLSPNTFVDVRWSKMDMEFPLQAKPDHPLFNGSINPRTDLDTGDWSGPPQREVFFQRDRNQFNGSLSHYIGGDSVSHDLKFGGDYARTQNFQPDRRGYVNGVVERTLGGLPDSVDLWNGPSDSIFDIVAPNANTSKGQNYAAFVQDSLTINNRLTITGGVRLDKSKTFLPAQSRLESNFPQLGALYQAADIAAIDNTTNWSDIVLRVSVVYDLSGDGRTALKGNFSQYSQQQGTTFGESLNPNAIGRSRYTWVDANGDDAFQFGEQTTLLSTRFPSVTTSIDPNLDSPILTEVTVGLEREVFENFLFSATFIKRSTNNIVEDINLGRTAALHTATSAQDPGPDGVLGTSDDQGTLTVFNLDPSLPSNQYFITNPERHGYDPFADYKGVSFVAHKRWSNNW